MLLVIRGLSRTGRLALAAAGEVVAEVRVGVAVAGAVDVADARAAIGAVVGQMRVVQMSQGG